MCNSFVFRIKLFFFNLFVKILKKGLIKLNKQGFLTSSIYQGNFTDQNNLILSGFNNIHESVSFIFNSDSKVILNGGNRIGRNVEIQPSEGKTIEFGYGTSIQDRNIILGDVVFGRYCLTAPNVYISSGRHYYEKYPNLYIKDQDSLVHNDEKLKSLHSKKVIIEDDVWIGINAVIMSGVKIGRGAVIGANSVVTSDIPPFMVVAGSPAKIIKKRLDFKPKIHISYHNDLDLPNFYSGIYVDLKNIDKSRQIGGLLCSNIFTLYLSCDGFKIKLILSNITKEDVFIEHDNQVVKLEPKVFSDIWFIKKNNEFLTFNIYNSINEIIDGGVLIKEAYVYCE